jgi:hypothetical protein
VDAITSKANSVKESGAAKVQGLIQKSEEIVKEVNLNRFPSLSLMKLILALYPCNAQKHMNTGCEFK